MATITKHVDRNVEDPKRYQYWSSSENADDGTVIAVNDIFLVKDTLGRPARYIYIKTAALTDLSIKFNTRRREYPLRDPVVNQPRRPDLENEVITIDTSMAAIPIAASDEITFQDVLPVSDITIVTFSAGSFELVVA